MTCNLPQNISSLASRLSRIHPAVTIKVIACWSSSPYQSYPPPHLGTRFWALYQDNKLSLWNPRTHSSCEPFEGGSEAVWNTIYKFPITSMGVLAPGSAHARPSARPPMDISRNKRRMFLQNHLQTSPPTPQKSYLKFRNPRTKT